MGLRYRKTVKLFPGVKLNISKSGLSTSVGRRGATLNFSRRGTRATVGIPGSGLSYSTNLRSRRKARPSRRELNETRANMMRKYGVSRSELMRFERRVKRNPKKFARMSEEQLEAYMKKGRLSPKINNAFRILIRAFFVIVLVILVLKFLTTLT